MKKTVEVEYVGEGDVHELIDLASQMHKAGHYVTLRFSNYGYQVNIQATLGGFEAGPFDMAADFNLGSYAKDVEAMNRAKNWMREVLADPAENKAVEVVG